MSYSQESLIAFVQAASLGSFSAAARKLGKSQSTVSEAISRLEIDMGVELFDRSSKHPTLTPIGQALLRKAEDVVGANDRLRQMASALTLGVEASLTIVISDAYQSANFRSWLFELGERFPELEVQCVFAEHEDAIGLVRSGCATLGIVPSERSYPPEIGFATLPEMTEFSVYVGAGHPLAEASLVEAEQLAATRSLRLTTLNGSAMHWDWMRQNRRRCWSAPTYLILLDLAVIGFGWAVLPRWLAESYGAGKLVELNVAGWPRTYSLDAVWSRDHLLGPAATWLLERLKRVE